MLDGFHRDEDFPAFRETPAWAHLCKLVWELTSRNPDPIRVTQIVVEDQERFWLLHPGEVCPGKEDSVGTDKATRLLMNWRTYFEGFSDSRSKFTKAWTRLSTLNPIFKQFECPFVPASEREIGRWCHNSTQFPTPPVNPRDQKASRSSKGVSHSNFDSLSQLQQI